MPGRVKYRTGHSPLLLVLGALLLGFVALSIYLGSRSLSNSTVPSDLPFDLTK